MLGPIRRLKQRKEAHSAATREINLLEKHTLSQTGNQLATKEKKKLIKNRVKQILNHLRAKPK
jgi:hypothetical protein